jgi:hypothetical protein
MPEPTLDQERVVIDVVNLNNNKDPELLQLAIVGRMLQTAVEVQHPGQWPNQKREF